MQYSSSPSGKRFSPNCQPRQYTARVDDPDVQPDPKPPAPPADPVPIAVLPAATSAHMVKCVLEDAGIPAAVVGEHSATTLQHLGSIMSITVLVPRQDYDRAMTVLDEAILGAGVPLRCSACGYDLGGLERQERCPECGAKYIDLRRRITLASRPGPPGETATAARVGAIVGILVIVGIVAALAAFIAWGMF